MIKKKVLFIVMMLLLLSLNTVCAMEFKVRVYNPTAHPVTFQIEAAACKWDVVPEDGVELCEYNHYKCCGFMGKSYDEWKGLNTDAYWQGGKSFPAVAHGLTSFTVYENHGIFQHATILVVASSDDKHIFYIVNSINHSYVQTVRGVKVISQCEKQFDNACHYAPGKKHDYTLELTG